MAAVLALALLLICGNVHAQPDFTAFITQARPENSTNQAIAPAITSPPEESGVTRNAVLATANDQVDIGEALVNLARAEDLKAASPSPAKEPAAPGPDSAESNVTGGGQFAADPTPGGTLKGGYPEIPTQPDYTGYGVAGGGVESPPGASLASTDATSGGQFAADPTTGGTLKGGYPEIPTQPDYNGYGVAGGGVESPPGASLASTDATSGGQFAADTTPGGTLKGGYPEIPTQPDYTGYGVAGGGVESPPGASLASTDATSGGQFAADTTPGGTLKGGYPEIPTQPDYTGYGVAGGGVESPPGASLASTDATSGGQFAADPTPGGTLKGGYPEIPTQPDYTGYGVAGGGVENPPGASLASTDATGGGQFAADPTPGGTLKGGYPEIPTQPDYTGYGVAGGGVESPPGASLASTDATSGGQFAADTTPGGTLKGGYPEIPTQPDYTGYGVAGGGVESPPGASLASTDATSGGQFAADPTTGGTLKGGYPEIPTQPDYTGYGVAGGGVESPPGASLASTDATSGGQFAADPTTGGTLKGGYPEIPTQPDYTGYGVAGGGVQSASSPPGAPGAQLAALSSGRTGTYASAPKPAQKSETWGQGNCTFYGGMDASGTMSGACGYGNLYASGYGAYTAALSSALFKNGMTCGACYEVACGGNAKSCKPGSVLVTVTNFCPPNPGQSAGNGGWCNGANRHFELSYPAFVKIADPKAGVVPLKYRRVPCLKTGGIRFTLNGNCNFNLLTITNVGGSGVVIEAYMKGDGMDWAPMSRSWGANWQCSRNYCGKGISVKIVTSDKKVSVSRLAGPDWAFGKTYIGQQVY